MREETSASQEADCTIILEEGNEARYPIRPGDFGESPTSALRSTFGKAEVEWAAAELIEFFQFKGCWSKFTLGELYRFYQIKGWDPDRMLFGLICPWFDDAMFFGGLRVPKPYLAMASDGSMVITSIFIEKAAKNIKKIAA